MYAEPIQYVRLFDNYFNIFLTFTIALLTGPCCTIIFLFNFTIYFIIRSNLFTRFHFYRKSNTNFLFDTCENFTNECDMEHISITRHFSFESPLNEKCMKIQWKFMFKE